MKTLKEKQIEIDLLTEKIQKISGKKIILEDSVFKSRKLEERTVKLKEEIRKIAKKEVSTLEAYVFFMRGNLENAEFINKTLASFDCSEVDYEAGNLEESLEKMGYRLTSDDISKMDIEVDSIGVPSLTDLIYNIFYNTDGLNSFVDKNTMKVIIKKLTGFEDKDCLINDIKVCNREKEYKQLLSVLVSEED